MAKRNNYLTPGITRCTLVFSPRDSMSGKSIKITVPISQGYPERELARLSATHCPDNHWLIGALDVTKTRWVD